jgi:hypothetical protein
MADGRLPKHKRIYLLIVFTGIPYYVINSDTVPIEICFWLENKSGFRNTKILQVFKRRRFLNGTTDVIIRMFSRQT